MAIDYTKALLHKGSLLALESTLKGAITNLNTALVNDTLAAPYVSTVAGLPGPMLASHVQIGDLTQTWALPANGTPTTGGIAGGAFRIRVCMPMNSPGFMSQKRTQSPSQGAGITTTIYSDIYVYAHNDLWREDNKDEQARNVCLVMATMEDWVRTTFNQRAGRALILPSFEYGNSASTQNTTGGDVLTNCLITNGSDGYYPYLIGKDTYLHALHLIHSGEAAV